MYCEQVKFLMNSCQLKFNLMLKVNGDTWVPKFSHEKLTKRGRKSRINEEHATGKYFSIYVSEVYHFCPRDKSPFIKELTHKMDTIRREGDK